jgi:hypothetical protein
LDSHRHAGNGEHPTPLPSTTPKRTPAPLATQHSSSSSPKRIPAPLAQHSSSPTNRKETPPPRRIRAPLKSVWKGPLPPRRITPTVTVGDYIIPAFSRSSPPRSRDPVSACDPSSPRFQKSTALVGPQPIRVGVERVTRSRSTACTVGSWAAHPKRQLVNPTLFHAPPLSYRDVLMAGSRGRFRGRHGPGRGAPVEHRGRGGNAAASRGAPDLNA